MSEVKAQKAIIIHSQELVLKGLESILNSIDITVTNSFTKTQNGLKSMMLCDYDIALIEAATYEESGIDTLSLIRKTCNNVAVVFIYSQPAPAYYSLSKKLGIHGAITTRDTTVQIKRCLSHIKLGEISISQSLELKLSKTEALQVRNSLLLNPSEIEILNLISHGKSNKFIALKLKKSIRTVEKFRSSIIEKLKLPKLTNALTIWVINNKELIQILARKN